MKIIHTFWVLIFASLLTLPAIVVTAPGGGSGGGSNAGGNSTTVGAGQGSGDQDRIQDRDQVRDPTTHDGTEPDRDQLRIQDRDRIMLVSPTTTGVAVGEQNQMRWQEQERIFYQNATNTADHLRASIQERERVMEQARLHATTSPLQNTLREQNRSLVAVQAILDVNPLFGNRAAEANRVAAEIRASIDQTVNMEEKIQSRGFFSRFFMGGDVATAKQLEVELLKTRTRIQDMDRLIQECDCDGPTRDLLKNQLRTLEQDRDRLNTLVADQYNRTGLFGWLFR